MPSTKCIQAYMKPLDDLYDQDYDEEGKQIIPNLLLSRDGLGRDVRSQNKKTFKIGKVADVFNNGRVNSTVLKRKINRYFKSKEAKPNYGK